MPARKGFPPVLDACLAGLVLLAASPLMVLVGLAVRLSSPGPVLFRQTRVGRHGREFVLFKFRSMHPNDERIQFTADGDARVTLFGRILRKAKLDELPELWNVIRGDMSLVGPRPEVPQYVDKSDPLWAETLRYRPGISDPATLALRNEGEMLARLGIDREKFYREVLLPYKCGEYVRYQRRRTFWSDLKVLFMSLIVIFLPSLAGAPSIETLRSLEPEKDRGFRAREP